MEPFNIKIPHQHTELTLTLLPGVDDHYLIVYYGGILGGVDKVDGDWKLSDPESISIDNLPIYRPSPQKNRIELVLTDQIAAAIGKRIEEHLENHTRKIPGHLRSIRD